jgi:hypothetical protein
MGLDVYAGTLTRYYAGAWETIVQRSARQGGEQVTVIRLNDPADVLTDTREIEAAVVAWRNAVNVGLKPHLSTPLDWDEGMGPPYFTDKPAWDCFSALMVWAAHDEHGDPDLPAVATDDWSSDAAVQRSQAEGFKSRYTQLLHGAELWLPGQFDFTFGVQELGGRDVNVGSLQTLLSELRDLNSRTWRMSDQAVAESRYHGADPGGAFEVSARFACSVFLELAAEAVKHRVPLRLDY